MTLCMAIALYCVSRFIVFCTKLTYSVAGYVQFVVGHDESNSKGIRIAKYLKISRCVWWWGGVQRERVWISTFLGSYVGQTH